MAAGLVDDTGMGSLRIKQIAGYQKALESDRSFAVSSLALSNNDVLDVLLTREANIRHHNQHFSTKQKFKEPKVTNQRSTGRCWLFAATNVMRLHMIDEYKLETFEFSQSYLFFWDKFEKANYFLESIIATAAQPVDSRLVNYLLRAPVQDGGQYDMFINIVNKYGLVPKSVYPESAHSQKSKDMNWLITFKLREHAQSLREMFSSGFSLEDLRSRKEEMVCEIYRIMVLFLGCPPTSFDWRFTNKSGDVVEHVGLTPLSFSNDLVPFNVDNQVSIVNDPRNDYFKTYTVEMLGNVTGGRPILYLNLPIEDMKRYAANTISGGDPVWFGCDVRKFFYGSHHTMDTEQFDYNLLFGINFEQKKADRLRYNQSLMTHAMVFTAFDGDLQSGINKWRVENSWGEKNNKGFATMTDSWFNEYTYQVVVDKGILSEEHLSILTQEPIVLPAWDPMGALA